MPTGVLYPRKVSLHVQNAAHKDIDLSQMGLTFDINQHDLETPNTMVVRLFNLSEDTAQMLLTSFGQESGGQVVLQAGYPENFGVIFSGSVTFYRKGRLNGTDSFLDIQSIDGDLAYCFSVVSQTLEAGASSLQDQLNAITPYLQEAGVGLGYIAPLPQNTSPRGKVLFGMARDRLRDIAKTAGMNWSIQQGQLQMLPKDDGYLPNVAVALGPKSGLIGVPEVQPDGLHVRALINPAFKPGQLLYIKDDKITDYLLGTSLSALKGEAPFLPTAAQLQRGVWIIRVCHTYGGTRENDFYTDMICTAPDQPISPALLPRL